MSLFVLVTDGTVRLSIEGSSVNAELGVAEQPDAGRARSQLLSAFRHELHTPLTAILGFSDLLKNRSAGELTAKQERYVDNIRRGGLQLLHLVDTVLEYASVQSDAPVEDDGAAARSLIEDVAAAARAEAERKGVTLELHTIAISNVVGERPRLARALRQLLDNAIQFTPKGGRVTVLTSEGVGFVQIAVEDTGIGIALADQKRIFEPFFRVDLTNDEGEGRSGLGLALAERVVNRHGGSLEVTSVPGHGSAFRMRLPVFSRPAETRLGAP